MKSETRKLAEKIQELTGKSLVWINAKASEYVGSGLCADMTEALVYMLELEKEG